nr:hypothetical protein CFP56_34857 [Quercus suber]
MLHWLAGQKAAEESVDPDATGAIDVPETPAPVFAVRAFKHAIFGTPQTAQPRVRRHSNTEATRPRTQDGKSQRPPMTRPKSASYAQDPVKAPDLVPEPVNSPTKGILLTPGTAAAKRKTVSFGDHIKTGDDDLLAIIDKDDEGAKGVPNQRSRPAADDDFHEDFVPKNRNMGSLTKALEQVRDESVKRKRASRDTKIGEAGEGVVSSELTNPQPESGRYWKAEYDAYRENTQREVRKLVKKQQMAKSYAKMKDDECLALTDELKLERLKVEKLEMQALRLEAQLKEYQTLLQNGQHNERLPQESAVSDRKNAVANYAQKTAGTKEYRTVRAGREGKSSEQPGAKVNENVEQSVSRENHEVVPVVDEIKVPALPDKSEAFGKVENNSKEDQDDVWASSFKPTSPKIPKRLDTALSVPTTGRTVTCGTGATPLKSLSINTLPTVRTTRRDSAQPSPQTEAVPGILTTREIATQPTSPTSFALPNAGSDRVSPTGPRLYHATYRKMRSAVPESESLTVSSPFEPNASFQHEDTSGKLHNTLRQTQPLIPPDSQILGPKKWTTNQDSLRPTAAWTAIGIAVPAPSEKRVSSITDKHGKEVAQERLEAAKARLRAKGRNVS